MMEPPAGAATGAGEGGKVGAQGGAVGAPGSGGRLADPIADLLRFEQSYLRVPFEEVKRCIRGRSRVVEKELASVMGSAKEIVAALSAAEAARKAAGGHLSGSLTHSPSHADMERLGVLVSKLQGLKRKLQENFQAEELNMQRCRSRLERVAQLTGLRREEQGRGGGREAQGAGKEERRERQEGGARSAPDERMADAGEERRGGEGVVGNGQSLGGGHAPAADAAAGDGGGGIEGMEEDGVRQGKVEQAVAEWAHFRFHRILVDYMLRFSHFDTALLMASYLGLQADVDTDMFQTAQHITEALKRRECGPALAWCTEQRAKLKKLKSDLEFQLRRQEFIELVRGDRMIEAVRYARKHLSPHAATHLKELQRAMAALAFRAHSDCSIYKELFDEGQWKQLADMFWRDVCGVFGITPASLLHIFLQAGLSVLKTPHGYEEGCTRQDPLSYDSFRTLARPLPYAKKIQSQLVCHITKELMDDHNPPMVLPNGYVYSRKAMEDMARSCHGKITCPRSGDTFAFHQLVKAFSV